VTPRSATSATPLTRLERAAGVALGIDPLVAPLRPDASRTPVEAFEDVLREALQRTPCMISFSGGRDSSALLAIAVSLARREGLPLPVPITLRFPGDAQAAEDTWQDTVLAHLQVGEREIVTVTGDMLDVVGPAATECLDRHGLLFPYNTYCHLPIVRAASGGSVVTGFGGDELAIASVARWAERAAWLGQRSARAVALQIFARSPYPIRFARNMGRRDTLAAMTPWLTRPATVRLRVQEARDNAGEPYGWGRVITERLWPSRWVQVARQHSQAMADWFDVQMCHPFADARVLRSIAAHTPYYGLGGRTDLVRDLFGRFLPDPIITRESKASFSTSIWSETALSFARTCSMAGVDQGYVDARRVRAAWQDRTVNSFSGSLLQQSWQAGNTSEPVATR
jgi:hypothetical protein